MLTVAGTRLSAAPHVSSSRLRSMIRRIALKSSQRQKRVNQSSLATLAYVATTMRSPRTCSVLASNLARNVARVPCPPVVFKHRSRKAHGRAGATLTKSVASSCCDESLPLNSISKLSDTFADTRRMPSEALAVKTLPSRLCKAYVPADAAFSQKGEKKSRETLTSLPR
eukprot:6195191-Pleurochrysis_carterae.AAC.2